MTRFHKLTQLIISIIPLFACTYEIEETNAENDGDDMTFAKSATGTLVSKGNNVIQVQDDFDGAAQNFTVQFWVGQRFAVGGGVVGTFTPVGEILWALGGNTQRRLVSIFNGTAVTGVAEHFTIKATDQTVPTDPSNPTQYDISITAARGVRGSTALPPTYQTYITSTGAGTALGRLIIVPQQTLYVPIPPDAGINSVMVTAVNTTDAAVPAGTDFEFAQAYFPLFELKRYNPTNYAFVPVSPQANNLFFHNLTPLVGGRPLEFSVTWGIDG
jgi:hypothetical protein